MIFTGKISRIFYLCWIITIILFVKSSEGKDCDCEIFKQALEEVQVRQQVLKNSGENEPEQRFLQCLDGANQAGLLFDYCANLTIAGEGGDLQTLHDKATKRIEGMMADCRKGPEDCGKWRDKMSVASVNFIEQSDEKRKGIKDFLYAKLNICDRKYEKDLVRKKRCVSNFKKKYGVQAILDSVKPGDNLQPSQNKVENAAKISPPKKEEQEEDNIESILIGTWQNITQGDMFEIKKKGYSLGIECLVGCGNGVRYEWLKEYSFKRIYSRSKRLGTGHFNEKCLFDDREKRFTCKGMLNFKTKFGETETKRLEDKHYYKLIGY